MAKKVTTPTYTLRQPFVPPGSSPGGGSSASEEREAPSINDFFHPLGGGHDTPREASPSRVHPPLGVRRRSILSIMACRALGIFYVIYFSG
jgi:hypothetical protein